MATGTQPSILGDRRQRGNNKIDRDKAMTVGMIVFAE
jgi:hypothetical protein